MFIKNNPGDAIASQELTVIDVSRNPELPGHRDIDDEDVETFDKPIIENGLLRSFLHNTDWRISADSQVITSNICNLYRENCNSFLL